MTLADRLLLWIPTFFFVFGRFINLKSKLAFHSLMCACGTALTYVAYHNGLYIEVVIAYALVDVADFIVVLIILYKKANSIEA